MKTQELRAKKNDELLKQLQENYEKLRDYRFQACVRKLKNPHLIKSTKKEIARILTILIERNYEQQQDQ